MHLPRQLVSLLSRVYRPAIDPRRAARVYQQYDAEQGYASYHEICKSRFERNLRHSAGRALDERGFHYLDVLDAERAGSILHRLQTEYAPSYVKKDTRDLQGFRVEDEMSAEVLSAILTDAVDEQLVNFFASEYLVHWVTFTVTPPADEQTSVSFRWHCDKGPRAHLKLLVYLNATDEHGGNTEFIDLEDTASVAARGYLFGWTQLRSSDVNEISRVAQRAVEPRVNAMQAGEGVLFQPASVLHRGISPTRGARYVITLCLLPSPVHWTVALDRGAVSDLAEDAKWYKNAAEILRRIDQPIS